MVQKLKFVLVAFIAVMATSLLQAQVTTSSMSGRVTDDEGPVIGAEVVATHVPSGTIYGTVTNLDGRYTLSGMRVGGPYSVEVSFIGKGTNTTEDVVLSLGEIYRHDIVLLDASLDLGEVVVSAERTKFTTEKTGASTNISNDQIVKMPMINRSISDVTKLSPYSGSGMSIAGADGRSTNFTVNGANFNNNFGLSDALPGGGSPISLDAIEEVQVAVAPFDVRQTNFIGGGVNAITKSGTNKFKGSLYTYFNNQDMRGNRIDDVDFGARNQESRTIYGATIGGPIIKNKLFFFINGELENRPGQVVTWRPSEDGNMDLTNNISRTKKSDMDLVKNHLMSKYGYDPGSYNDYPGDIGDRKLLAQLDWNINNANRFRLTYNYALHQQWFGTNGNSTSGARHSNMNRISQYAMAFSNSIYSMDNLVNSLTAELNSRLSDNMSNQLLATYTAIKDMRGSTSDPFPFIDILNGDGDNLVLEPYISAGYELFTWNNGVNNNVITITDNFTYYMDKHKLTAGVNFEYQMANNSFMRYGTGYYRYASLDDFLNDKAPTDVAVTYGYGGELNPAAEVSFNQYGAYLQDEWNLTNNFKLTLGLRADLLNFNQDLMGNDAIKNLDYNGTHLDVGLWPTAKVQISPRLGFNWDVNGDNSLKVRGGTGIFQGRLPLVFFTNMPTNSGMVQGSGQANTDFNTGERDPRLENFAGGMETDPIKIAEKLGLDLDMSPDRGALPAEINAVDPNFKMPQVWKTSIGADFQLPTSFPMTISVEGIFNKSINDVMLKNYNWQDIDENWDRFSGSDDRVKYPSNLNDIKLTEREAFVLTNTQEGWGAIGNITLTAQPVRDLDILLAYTYTESKEISGMPGSQASSAYGNLITIDGPHSPTLMRSQYVIPHRVISSISYRLPWSWSNNFNSATFVNLFYSGQHASRYSYMYSNDMNGDGRNNDLMYIPTGKGDIKFATAEDETAFFEFMEQDKYLSANKGKYAEAYSALAPWSNRFDLRLARQYYFNVAGRENTLELSINFLNVGNLFNSKWGVVKTPLVSNTGRVLTKTGEEDGAPVYSFVKRNGEYLTETFDLDYHYNQTWKLQVGLKYIF